MDFEFALPTRILFGENKLSCVGEVAASLGRSALLVVDPFCVESGLAGEVEERLKKAGLGCVLFGRVEPNPTTVLVEAAAEVARSNRCDLVIGLGGGSSMDTAKAVAVAATHDGGIWPYAMGEKEITDATLPVIAITTTSGTGSQCTCFSVLTNPETNQKPGMGSPHILPKAAIVDPRLMLSMPPALTAMTGIDVLTHAVEAYTSNAASAMSDMFAEKALVLAAEHLPACYADGRNRESRAAMALADTCAGIAICHAVVSLAHVMAHVIGGHFHDIAHGAALHAIYPGVLALNQPALPEKHERIAGILSPGYTDAAEAYRRFTEVFDLPNALAVHAPSEESIRTLARDTFTYMKPIVELNPAAADEDAVRAILAGAARPAPAAAG